MLFIVFNPLSEFFNALEVLFFSIDTIFTVIGVSVTIITAFYALCKGGAKKIIRRQKLRKILGFKKGVKSEIILPVWNGTLEYSEKEAREYRKQYGRSVQQSKYVFMDEAASLIVAQRVFSEARINDELVLKTYEEGNFDSKDNQIVLGGPLSNSYQFNLFDYEGTSYFSFKKKFLFGCRPLSYAAKKHNGKQKILKEIATDTNWRHSFFLQDIDEEMANGKFDQIVIPQNYIILIRKKEKNHGTVFSCFGNSAFMSQRSLSCLLDHTNDIYKLVKKHKDQFFLIFKCSTNGDMFFDTKNVMDLTNIMF